MRNTSFRRPALIQVLAATNPVARQQVNRMAAMHISQGVPHPRSPPRYGSAGRQKLRRKQLSEGDATYWYSSEVESTLPLASTPPTTSTFPFPSNVAVCQERAVVIFPVYVKVTLVGLNSSALAKGVTDV